MGEALKPIRDKVIIATKFRIAKTSEEFSKEMILHQIRTHMDASLKRLRTDHIDLYY